MFRLAYSSSIRAIILRARLSRSAAAAKFSSTSTLGENQPNEPVDLDPSFKALLRDVDISLLKHKQNPDSAVVHPMPPLQVLDFELVEEGEAPRDAVAGEREGDEDYHVGRREPRKSPAALFGSQSIGEVILPLELRNSIDRLVEESDKRTLHSDALRLFAHDPPPSSTRSKHPPKKTWEASYELRTYKSSKQAARHAARDGTAFATIALPAHYAAIYAVLDHIKRRLEREWDVQRVIDWGTGTGTGLWATMHAFQKPPDAEKGISADNPQLRHSNIITYTGIDKREGLVTIGKRLLHNVDIGPLSVSWKKSWQEEDKMNRKKGGDTIALSAFMLSALHDGQARKALVKEMWESGAGVMVLIDHASTTGFECIAEAREYLLNVGRKEFEDPAAAEWDIRGSHVVAPCPHDAACPLRNPSATTKLVCSFSQRLQRPSFVRLTKHSGIGYEDTRYSYVVIRRGERPGGVGVKGVGRVGAVGREALEKEAEKEAKRKKVVRELVVHGENEHQHEELTTDSDATAAVEHQSASNSDLADSRSAEELQEALRLEAFGWSRLVFPPMKRNKHIILDSCTAEGKVKRITIPKSQGRQAFYDARKSSWGDMFPHAPKNAPQERFQPKRTTKKDKDEYDDPVKGAHIGKRNKKEKGTVARASYELLADDLKKEKKRVRKERLKVTEVDFDEQILD